jgi:hypothetical protein
VVWRDKLVLAAAVAERALIIIVDALLQLPLPLPLPLLLLRRRLRLWLSLSPRLEGHRLEFIGTAEAIFARV